jgi:hypothetical protein
MTWVLESHAIERFGAAGIPKEKISFVRDSFTFNFPDAPAGLVDIFRNYYGPTMNAFAAAEKNGRAAELAAQLVALFEKENRSLSKNLTSIPATYLRVTVLV